jgi:hypothetical protein
MSIVKFPHLSTSESRMATVRRVGKPRPETRITGAIPLRCILGQYTPWRSGTLVRPSIQRLDSPDIATVVVIAAETRNGGQWLVTLLITYHSLFLQEANLYTLLARHSPRKNPNRKMDVSHSPWLPNQLRYGLLVDTLNNAASCFLFQGHASHGLLLHTG